MKMIQTYDATKYEVVCSNYEGPSRFYLFVNQLTEDEDVDISTEEIAQEIRKQIEDQVNPKGFWEKVEITQVGQVLGKQYRAKI